MDSAKTTKLKLSKVLISQILARSWTSSSWKLESVDVQFSVREKYVSGRANKKVDLD